MDNEKFKRLNKRLEELEDLNKKIEYLAFFMNEDSAEKSDTEMQQLALQIETMQDYRTILEDRIFEGNF